MIPFDYARPSTAKAAIDAVVRDKSARFIAGGSNLVDLMKRGVMTPEKIIDINALPLRGIARTGKTIRIRALTLNSAVAADPVITERLPLLAQALKAGASPQIRNMATVGGNLMQRTRCPYFYDTALPCNKRAPGSGCSALNGYNRMHAIIGFSESCIAVNPSDMNVALAALDATVIVQGPKGERHIPIADFHRLPGNTPQLDTNLQRDELITAVEIPDAPGFATTSLYTKVRDRASYAFALVSVAAALHIENGSIRDARLAMGGIAHKPWRLRRTEDYIRRQQPSIRLFNNAALADLKEARGHGHNNFKLVLAPNTIAQTLRTLAGLA
ncbi:MAG: xanthine dehydrogenase family protein subunit [Flaviaesturariibacter sp.]|nr:xanthine dehydrogenase family protein subunit [Flaviaesturariibacter sp.]